VDTAVFEPNIFWMAVSALNFVVAGVFLWAVVWTVRRLRSINALERRVSDLEKRLAERDQARD
jgi:uncharacterized membrane protein